MVRQEKTLVGINIMMKLGLSTKECQIIEQTKEFQACLRGERSRYYKEIATDPQRSKIAKIGNLELLATKLEEDGQHEKAAKVHMDIAKLEGWTDATTTVNVFGDLSAKDLQTMKDRIKKEVVSVQ